MTRATIGAFLLVVPSLVWGVAMPPGVVNYQGVLRSASGAPLSGTYDMIFRFVDEPSGGTLLLTDYHTGPNGVVVTGGLFSAVLGAGTLSPGVAADLEAVFANYAPVWIEVQVGAETLSPRIEVVSSAFAINAGRLGGLIADDYVNRTGANQTKAGFLASNAGLFGNAAAGNGTGVEGQSLSGNGVRGTATATAGSAVGVYGKSNSTDGTAVYGEAAAVSGPAWGVYGKTASTSGVGVLGSALATSGATEGVRGQTASPTGRGVVGAAFTATGLNFAVYGENQSNQGTGVYGKVTATGGGTTGVIGDSASTVGTGVAGIARATSGDAWGVYGETASATGYGVVAVGSLAVDGDIYATGGKFFLTEHPTAADRAIQYACLEGGEVGVYHRGTARLEKGAAWVPLPEEFPLVANGDLTVQVTPLEDCGGLYVPPGETTTRGFAVREAGGGASSAEFSYLVIAERLGHESAAAVRGISLGEKILISPRFAPEQRGALRAALARAEAAGADVSSGPEAFESLHRGDFAGACAALGGCTTGGRPDVPRLSARVEAARPPGAALAATGTQEAAAPRDASAPTDEPGRSPVRDLTRANLSELHLVSETVEAGDVVVIDRGREGALRPGSVPFDPAVVGVIASAPAPVSAGSEAPVALLGTVLCKVDADYGAVAPGDLLVVSPTPGHAMRVRDAAPPGTVVGKALESLGSGRGVIQVLLTLR